MAESMTQTVGGTVDGKSVAERVTKTGTRRVRTSYDVPPAKTGTLTTRTDNDTAVLTMAGGHGFATSDKLDVFWAGGSRRNMTATVATNAVTVDGGSGDNLPVLNTAVTAMKPLTLPLDLADGDAAVGITAECPGPGYVVLVDDGPADVALGTFRVLSGSTGHTWVSGYPVTAPVANPIASTVLTAVKFSHGDSTNTRTLAATILVNDTPS